VQTQTIVLNDEDVTRLDALAREYPGALVSGELVVDAPELLRLAAVGADQLATINLTGNMLKITYRPLGQFVMDLRDQYVTGNLALKIILKWMLKYPLHMRFEDLRDNLTYLWLFFNDFSRVPNRAQAVIRDKS
jgi:hypothetical protein